MLAMGKHAVVYLLLIFDGPRVWNVPNQTAKAIRCRVLKHESLWFGGVCGMCQTAAGSVENASVNIKSGGN